ncbi:DNA-binding protein D-ETS-3-like, partial [Penaeus japonicus]|uniref:DNA-binding protein D-ETS-3-like n=1 Tax=Penaeus japonicus TaxID=27405 RepID=UPI001C71539D
WREAIKNFAGFLGLSLTPSRSNDPGTSEQPRPSSSYFSEVARLISVKCDIPTAVGKVIPFGLLSTQDLSSTHDPLPPRTYTSSDNSLPPHTFTSAHDPSRISFLPHTSRSTYDPTHSSLLPHSSNSTPDPPDNSLLPHTSNNTYDLIDNALLPHTPKSIYDPTDSCLLPHTSNSTYDPAHSSLLPHSSNSTYDPTDSSLLPHTSKNSYDPTDSSLLPQTSNSTYDPTLSSLLPHISKNTYDPTDSSLLHHSLPSTQNCLFPRAHSTPASAQRGHSPHAASLNVLEKLPRSSPSANLSVGGERKGKRVNGARNDQRETLASGSAKTSASRRKPKPRTSRKNTGMVWEFLRDLLLDPESNPALLKWEDPVEGSFRLVQPEEVAARWGLLKKNTSMNYEKLSRALRYHYRIQTLIRSRHKLVYKFGPKASGWKRA